jgi:dTDP-4-amino-4,6-dideoxygalactose transaminase
MIPFFDLKSQNDELREEIDRSVRDVIESCNFISGKSISEFEEDFARFIDVRHCTGVSSGTEALRLSLWACGIKDNDEVITVPYTFIATVEAVTMLHATPVFVDIDEKFHTINPCLIEEKITEKTRAILPVHICGIPADMDPIIEIARKHNLLIIEDAAQAHGSKYKNRFCGSIGNMGCFSFYPAKNLGAFGDAGAVTTDSSEFASKIRLLRDHGRTGRYEHEIAGTNSRMDTLQAAVLRVKLKRLDEWNRKRQQAVSLYHQMLSDISGVILPSVPDYAVWNAYLYVIQVENHEYVQSKMKECGISTIIHNPVPSHLQKAFDFLGYKKGDFPVSEKVASKVLSLPLWPQIRKEQIIKVCEALRNVLK